MAKINGTWKVTNTDNLETYLETIDKLHSKKLALVNYPIERKINSIIKVGELKLNINQPFYNNQELFDFEIPLTNISQDTITNAWLKLAKSESSYSLLLFDGPISPSKTRTSSVYVVYNSPISKAQLINDIDKAKPKITRLIFNHKGKVDTLDCFEYWEDYINAVEKNN